MTCVVGLVDQNGVTIGGDSALTSVWDRTVMRGRKVFRRGNMLFGYSGNLRHGQLLQYIFQIPERPDGMDLEEYLSARFMAALRLCFNDDDHGEKNVQEDLDESHYLIGIDGRLFTLEHNYIFTESLAGFDAIGKGANIARGALYATGQFAERTGLSAQDRVRLALEAAEQWSTAVCRPFVIETLSADEDTSLGQ